MKDRLIFIAYQILFEFGIFLTSFYLFYPYPYHIKEKRFIRPSFYLLFTQIPTMKFFGLITFVLLMHSAMAQDISYFLYKTDSKSGSTQVEVKSNDHYILCDRPGLPAGSAAVFPYKILDIKNNVGIWVNDKASRKWYHMDLLDTMFNRVNKLNTPHEKKTVNGHLCEKFIVDTKIDHDAGLYGLATWEYDYTYVLWVATDMKPAGKISKYLLGLITYGVANAELPGVPVKIEFKMTKGDKVISEGDMLLDKSSTATIKDADIKLPWKDEDIKPAIADAKVSKTSLWTDEEYKPYTERLKALYLKVTGQEVKRFFPTRLSPFF